MQLSHATTLRGQQARPVQRTSSYMRHNGQRLVNARDTRAFQQGAESLGFASDTFKQALQEALQRDKSAESAFTSRSGSGGYSSNSNGGNSAAYERSLRTAAASEASPLLQVLATALSQSRSTLERLQVEEAEIEALIQREQKQVERLTWLLEKVQQDYAYFNGLQKRFEEESGTGSRW